MTVSRWRLPGWLPGMDHREILAGQNVAIRHRNARVHHVAAGGYVVGVCGHVVDGDGAAGNGGGVGRAGVQVAQWWKLTAPVGTSTGTTSTSACGGSWVGSY